MRLSTARLLMWILVLILLVMYRYRESLGGGMFYLALIIWVAALMILFFFGKCPHCKKRIFNLEAKKCPHCGKDPQL